MAGANPQSAFDIPLDDAEETGLDDAAKAEIEAGRCIPHDHMREWLSLRAKGKKVPPPTR